MIADRINGGLRKVPVWAVYALGAVPFVVLAAGVVANTLGPDPVKAIEHDLGKRGLQFLIASLAVTPLRRYAGINLIRFRRALGLLAFYYIVAHFVVWLALDMQFFMAQIGKDIVKRPYITIGFAALLMLIPLALTSTDAMVRRLGGARWRRLHRLVYPAAILAGAHYLWLVKAWPPEPILYMAGVLALLALRLKWPKRPALA